MEMEIGLKRRKLNGSIRRILKIITFQIKTYLLDLPLIFPPYFFGSGSWEEAKEDSAQELFSQYSLSQFLSLYGITPDSDKYLNVCFRKWASETNNRNQECLIAQLGTQNYKGQVSKQLICCWKCILSRTIDCESLKGMNDKLYHFTSSGFSAVPGTQ